MNRALAAMIMAIGVAAAIPAYAKDGASCGSVPKEKWLTEEAVKAKMKELGYDVRSIKPEYGCYEVKAVDKSGARIEINVHPETGAPVAAPTRKEKS